MEFACVNHNAEWCTIMVPRVHFRRICLITLAGALLILDVLIIKEYPTHATASEDKERDVGLISNTINSTRMTRIAVAVVPLTELLGDNSHITDFIMNEDAFNQTPLRYYQHEPAIYHMGAINKQDEESQYNCTVDSSTMRESKSLNSVDEFFRWLHTPQAKCRKLLRLGGHLCTPGAKRLTMDGHKLLCVDQELGVIAKPRLTAKNTSNGIQSQNYTAGCLVLSFGVQYDTTFDKRVAELPCEVHMFDIIDFKPGIVDLYDYVNFHQFGLGDTKRMGGFIHAYTGKIFYTPVNTLRGLMFDLGLQKRLLHVLKIDIEGHEWDVLEQLSQDLVLDQVGQIALEIHSFDLLSLPTSQHKENLEKKYSVIKAIESRGFRRVSFWDNIQDQYAFHSPAGCRYETSGEVLYVNTNWYNATFKNTNLYRYI